MNCNKNAEKMGGFVLFFLIYNKKMQLIKVDEETVL